MTLVTLISVKITTMLTIYHEVFNDMKNGGSWGNDNYNYNEDDKIMMLMPSIPLDLLIV